MAGGLGRRMSGHAMNWVFNKTATAPGTTYYISLHPGDPGEDGQSNAEPTSTGGYARASIAAAALTAAATNAALPVAVSNTGTLSFPQSSAAWSTGATALTYFGVWDHATNTAEGNFIGRGLLGGGGQAVNGANITLSFAAGQLTMSINDT